MLVLRPGALGDTLLAVPALRALRRSFATLRLAAHGSAARLLAAVGEVDRGISFDDPSIAPWVTGNRFPSDEPVIAWMASKVGAALKEQATVVAPSRPVHGNEHCARYLLRTLASLGIELNWDDRPLCVTPVVSDEVLIHPGSGSPSKNWPARRFAQVIRGLDGPVRLIVGEADESAANAVDEESGYRLDRLVQPSLSELAARLAGCHAYLGNDSGVSHLAGLCGARTVAMFGPTDPAVWQPIGPDVHVLPFDTTVYEVVEVLTDS